MSFQITRFLHSYYSALSKVEKHIIPGFQNNTKFQFADPTFHAIISNKTTNWKYEYE